MFLKGCGLQNPLNCRNNNEVCPGRDGYSNTANLLGSGEYQGSGCTMMVGCLWPMLICKTCLHAEGCICEKWRYRSPRRTCSVPCPWAEATSYTIPIIESQRQSWLSLTVQELWAWPRHCVSGFAVSSLCRVPSQGLRGWITCFAACVSVLPSKYEQGFLDFCHFPSLLCGCCVKNRGKFICTCL